MSKSKQNNLLGKVAKKQSQEADSRDINLKLKEAALLSLTEKSEGENAYVNMKYYRHEHQCLSSWQPDELRAFSSFCRKMTQISWNDIHKSGGKPGTKTGFGYTPHKDRSVLPEVAELDKISPDLTWFELRVTQEARVHGFRCKSAFFLVFLDRGHEIYPG